MVRVIKSYLWHTHKGSAVKSLVYTSFWGSVCEFEFMAALLQQSVVVFFRHVSLFVTLSTVLLLQTKLCLRRLFCHWNLGVGVLKCLQLYETSLVRHGLMMIGPAGSGKSQAITTLLEALTEVRKKHVQISMNPKAIRFVVCFMDLLQIEYILSVQTGRPIYWYILYRISRTCAKMTISRLNHQAALLSHFRWNLHTTCKNADRRTH